MKWCSVSQTASKPRLSRLAIWSNSARYRLVAGRAHRAGLRKSYRTPSRRRGNLASLASPGSLTDDRPLHRDVPAGLGEHASANALEPLGNGCLVDRGHAAVLDHDAAVDQHGVHAVAIRGKD